MDIDPLGRAARREGTGELVSLMPALLLALGVVGLTALGLLAFLAWLDSIGGGPRTINVYVDQRQPAPKGIDWDAEFRALERRSG